MDLKRQAKELFREHYSRILRKVIIFYIILSVIFLIVDFRYPIFYFILFFALYATFLIWELVLKEAKLNIKEGDE